jgi:hypothetical protein
MLPPNPDPGFALPWTLADLLFLSLALQSTFSLSFALLAWNDFDRRWKQGEGQG